jgi:hypothetical protein
VALTQRKRNLVVSGAVAAVLITVAAFGGCSSSSIPPAATEAQTELLRRTHFKATLAVEPYKYPIYSDHLIRDLRATGLFDSVDSLEKVEKPHLIARIERPIHGTAVVPLWTILTLGVVPTSVEEEHGHAFSIRRAGDPLSGVAVEYSYRGPTTLGWGAAFLNLFPNRTSGDPTETPRFREGLAIAVVTRGGDISALVR